MRQTKQKYKIGYWAGYWVLYERKSGFLWIPYWSMISAQETLKGIEDIRAILLKLNSDNENS